MIYKTLLKQLKKNQFAVAVEKDKSISTLLRKKDKIIYRYYGSKTEYAGGYSFDPKDAETHKRLNELNWKILK